MIGPTEELEEEVPDADGERKCRALSHRGELPFDVVDIRSDEDLVHVAQTELIEGVGDRLLHVHEQDGPVLLQVAGVLRDARDHQPAAAKNDSEKGKEDRQRGQGSREGEPAFDCAHNW